MATLPVKVSRTAFHRRVGRAGIALIPPARAYVAFDTKTQLREKYASLFPISKLLP